MKEETTSLAKLLFGGYFSSEEDEKLAYKWLLENQSRAVIFFDGLDQVPFTLNECGDKSIRTFDEAKTSTIFYNLLSRNLLPQTPIVISSREFAVAKLPKDQTVSLRMAQEKCPELLDDDFKLMFLRSVSTG